jgi:DNA polymerase-3 subunit beta
VGDDRSIGELARESGLSVSALRFYDGAGVLRPARVDGGTGYRWYAAGQVRQARLIAALRRVRMPLPDICTVLAGGGAATAVLDRHLRRLEDGLTDARRQLAAARDLLTNVEARMTRLMINGADLDAAVAAVRFAVSADPELPALTGILLDFDGTVLRLVATDRFRLAVATVPVRGQDGPPAQALVPAGGLTGGAGAGGDLTLELSPSVVTLGDRKLDTLDAAFPDYRRLLPGEPARQVTVPAAELRERLAAGPVRIVQAHTVSALLVGDGRVEVIDHDHPDAIGVNREFLLQAIEAGGAGQLRLGLDGPIEPLVLLDPDRPGDLSLLMPVRLTS